MNFCFILIRFNLRKFPGFNENTLTNIQNGPDLQQNSQRNPNFYVLCTIYQFQQGFLNTLYLIVEL